MSEPTNIAPEPESTPQPDVLDVLVLPAEYFFIETVEVPPALAAHELADFAELSMEAIAPFPLEQLRWGFLTAPDGQQILIYAALRDRLKRAGHAELETYTWVLPDFATLHGARFDRDLEITIEGDTFDTCLLHPSGETLPENIRSLHKHATNNKNQKWLPEGSHLRMSAPSGAEQAQATPDEQSKNPSSPAHSNDSYQSLHLRALPVELTEKGIPIFQFETLGEQPASGHWSPLKPDEATLWQADIRPAAYKNDERSARRTTALVTRIMGYAALFAIFLILLEGILFAGQLWSQSRQTKIDGQSTAVRRVEDKQSLMNKLEQVAQNELRPIAILEAANQIRINLGNTGIEYDEVVIEDGNRITIEGKSNTINELNAYTEALRKSGNFTLVETPKSITRSGKTTFTVSLDYVHAEPSSPQATPVASPASSRSSHTQTDAAASEARPGAPAKQGGEE